MMNKKIAFILGGGGIVALIVLLLVFLPKNSSQTLETQDVQKQIVAIVGEANDCTACHGSNLEGNDDIGAPSLAAQQAGYMNKYLHFYKEAEEGTGSDKEQMMSSIAQQLSEKEITQLVAYISSLEPAHQKNNTLSFTPTQVAFGKQIVNNGIPNKQVPSCKTCHGPALRGSTPNTNLSLDNSGVPNIASLSPAYILERIKDYRAKREELADEKKRNVIGMYHVANSISNKELAAVTAYLTSVQGKDLVAFDEKQLQRAPVFYTVKPLPERILWEKAEGSYKKQQKRYQTYTFDNTHFAEKVDFNAIPKGPGGDMIRLGKYLFENTNVLKGKYVGNDLKCANCHLDHGLNKETAPIYATAVDFPKYRSKNHRVNSFVERIAGCFKYSMDGTPPSAQSKTMVAIISYIKWLSKGIPSGAKLKYRGFKYLPLPANYEKEAFQPKYARGKALYVEKCQSCHQETGEGQFAKIKTASGTVKQYSIPPLWGNNSYNWGAGIHKVEKAAAFIKAAMPLGSSLHNQKLLTDKEAWDLAVFIDSQDRPQDPRYLGNTKKTRSVFHNSTTPYGLKNPETGKLLGAAKLEKKPPGDNDPPFSVTFKQKK